MKTATAQLKSISPYSQSRGHQEEKLEKEGADEYDKRTWRSRLHVDNKGTVIIPPMAFKNALSEIARFLSKQIPGKGKSTYTKHFEAGVLCIDPINTGIQADEVGYEDLFVPSDGKRGGGKRVWRRFPLIMEWSGTAIFTVIDETITEKVFAEHLEEAGKFIGVGRFRPRNNGFYGRFALEKLTWR